MRFKMKLKDEDEFLHYLLLDMIHFQLEVYQYETFKHMTEVIEACYDEFLKVFKDELPKILEIDFIHCLEKKDYFVKKFDFALNIMCAEVHRNYKYEI